MPPQSIPPKGERLNRVEPGSFLTLHYRLRGADGAAFVDTFSTQPATLSLGTGELAPAMEARLIGMEAGSEGSFELAAGEVFGEPDPGLVQRVSRALLAREGDADDDYRVGDVVRFPGPDGGTIAAVVRSIDADSLLFDFNHPLAGRPLTFDVKLIGVIPS
jgi:FKBP-type peptidyl-prolyl cis-trans isomerase SlpA